MTAGELLPLVVASLERARAQDTLDFVEARVLGAGVAQAADGQAIRSGLLAHIDAVQTTMASVTPTLGADAIAAAFVGYLRGRGATELAAEFAKDMSSFGPDLLWTAGPGGPFPRVVYWLAALIATEGPRLPAQPVPLPGGWHSQVGTPAPVVEPTPPATTEQRKVPALVAALVGTLTTIHQPGLRVEAGVVLTDTGAQVATVRAEDLLVPAIDAAAMETLLARGVGLMGSITAHRVLRWEVFEGCRRVSEGHPDPRRLCVEGGWREFAVEVGAGPGGAARAAVHSVVVAQAHLWFRLPDGSHGNLLSLRVRPAHRGQRGAITLVLGDALLPHYLVDRRVPGRSGREDRRLVPIVPLPPMAGRDNEHGVQATLQLLVLLELRRRARELASAGAAHLPSELIAELAGRVGLPMRLVPTVLSAWVTGDDITTPFLTALGDERYTLADPTARDFLVAGGQAELDGARWQQKSRGQRR